MDDCCVPPRWATLSPRSAPTSLRSTPSLDLKALKGARVSAYLCSLGLHVLKYRKRGNVF